jgi:hypothetical protein
MAQSSVFKDNSNGDKWHKVRFLKVILMGKIAQSSVSKDNSNGDKWHKVLFVKVILTWTNGSKFSF